ncbi:acyl-CoA/acyl-ACP dehydrogenase [Streptomyces sp. NBC_01260]|uniref:acyl-CoA dehydrogenase family protein n=1 Tax=unclassified Streptomyces TaxID=2593676 RepID=UPI000F558CB3|nr:MULTISPECIES: acyl-CoA dehydrogenase family protein [unclassified Streptomyces]MCX4771321.1 acyl-CoA/acyl-ACP dehydrogenase [Streptomyces sp. NBC_01285]RPK47737.1 Acryloyl-CoA reductase (NADH) [Streptomyces sp. ADI92-24]
MDFTFTEEQQAAAEAARAVFSGVEPDAVPSPALVPGAVAEDIDRPLWAGLAAGDLLSLTLSPEHGGAGLDLIALCLVLRESAKVLARVPLLETCAVAMTLQRYGDQELAAELLPGVGRGELVLTVGANGRTGHDPAELAVTARPADDGREADGDAGDGSEAVWVLDGVQSAVPWAQAADWIAVPAHTGDGRAVLALIRRGHDGVTIAEQVSTSGELFGEVRLDAVRIARRELIDAAGAWEWLHALLTTGTCALALGLGEAVLAMTSQYTGKREQFGFPVATFQSVAVQTADRYIDLRAMEVTLWQAAWRIATGGSGTLPAAGDVAVAKIWASDGVRRVVQTAQHLHGGFGADTDYPLHRFHAWAKQIELSLGPAAAHEEALGDLLAAHSLD